MATKKYIKKGICFDAKMVRQIRTLSKAEEFSFSKTVRMLVNLGLEQTSNFAESLRVLGLLGFPPASKPRPLRRRANAGGKTGAANAASTSARPR